MLFCNLVLSCSLCVLYLSLHEFCKTTFVPTYVLLDKIVICNNLFSNLIVFPTAAFSIRFSYSVLKVHSFLRASRFHTLLFTELPQRWAQVDSNHRPRAYQARALTA